MFSTGTTPREAFDRLQIAALVGLMFIGTAFVFSATMVNDLAATQPWYDQTWVRCVCWTITRWRAGRSWPIGR